LRETIKIRTRGRKNEIEVETLKGNELWGGRRGGGGRVGG